MRQCSTSYFAGAGECKALLENIEGGFLLKRGHTAITKAAGITLAGWKTILAPATIAAIQGVFLDGSNGTEPSGGENQVVVANGGKSINTTPSNNMLTLYANMSWFDYVNYFSMEGKPFKFFPIDKTNSLYNTNASNVNLTGFSCHFACSKALPKGGQDAVKSYPFFIYFDNIEEFGEKMEILHTDFSYDEAANDILPIGLTGKVTIAMANTTGFVTIKVTNRNGTAPNALLTEPANYVVLSANDVGVSVSVVDDAAAATGDYKLTILTGAGGNITGDVWIQGFAVSGSNITYITNPIKIVKYTA